MLADRWFSSQSNMSYIHNVGKKFIMGIKSNRCVALTEKDKENGKYQQLKRPPSYEVQHPVESSLP
ncbi:hypothetical protein PsalMR5_03399 [Piscirickettsia salmonis]|nr:hypothetical protein [Piscirickettsia salmonis]QGP55924.1 hypothetical protein PsalSR1_03394 [Piscirickettsia salmonis]QGP58205.1 hypothetical protein PsalBI1_00759 [Piscirickettsia salmonis]QGP65493.1 hypothetical protein PsalMR5_03399 [Piscirickettsia salmonis]